MILPKTLLVSMLMLLSFDVQANEYHVSLEGNDQNPGTESQPFRTISAAAKMAVAGDTITVYEGVYREKVVPPRGGDNDLKRILYRAAPGERVEIKGSEVISDWQQEGNGVWKTTIDNDFFGEYNPYQVIVEGDWYSDGGRDHHTGEVYLNEKSLYEMPSLEMVQNPSTVESSIDPEGSLYQWYSESDDETTTIWANFHEYNPNEELVEINVRNSCFYPDRPGMDYITVRGFHMSQAATQWAPPTAEQIGLIGTHWSKGWIIEENTLSNSKTVGITLGKDRETGQNVWTNNPVKDGATSYNEVIFKALNSGWSKENVGSHIVRNNTIFNTEQAGIVGSLGAIFSEISNNHIYDIWTKRMFGGAELAGLKFHAPIDMVIKNNRINNTAIGIWIDWMAQGTRITGNLIYDSAIDDLFTEVNHGPYLVDNNIFLSDVAIRDVAQGGAFVHNLIGGKMEHHQVLDRATPYHLPHSTKVAGITNTLGGDNRFYNNIFIKRPDVTVEEHRFFGLNGYETAEFPNFAQGNVFYTGAEPGDTDTDYINRPRFNTEVTLKEEGDEVFLHITFDSHITKMENPLVTTQLLGTTIITEGIYVDMHETHYIINMDYLDNVRNEDNPTPGPFEEIKEGSMIFKVW